MNKKGFDTLKAAWFVDGAYMMKAWNALNTQTRLDFVKMRKMLEITYLTQEGDKIEDAYYFSADPEPSTSRLNSFHNALAFPPPNGPGLRVKLYWVQKKTMYWPSQMGGGPVTHPVTGVQYEQTTQKAVDVGLAFHLMRSFGKKKWGTLFLAAGDSDFHEVVQHLVENEDVNLVLIGTMNTISEELRPYAQSIFELDKNHKEISR